MFSITKSFRFEAAHHLPGLPEGHKCARPHGHSYRVVIELTAYPLSVHGFVLDYGDLDVIAKDIAEHLDHRDLNEIANGNWPTTAECLARFFYYRWLKLLRALPSWDERIVFRSVTVQETERTSATYIQELQ